MNSRRRLISKVKHSWGGSLNWSAMVILSPEALEKRRNQFFRKIANNMKHRFSKYAKLHSIKPKRRFKHRKKITKRSVIK